MKTKLSITLVYLLVCMTSCEKTANETDPVKIIIGKWETIEMGNWPNMEPVEPIGYREFLSDSVLIEYSYQTQEFKYKKYWIDSLLYECFLLENLSTCTLVRRYSFEFFDNNKKLRLDYVDIAALFNTFILKRKD